MLFNLFAQAYDSAPPMQATNLSYGIVILVLVALVLGASTINAHRKLSWSASLTQGLGSLLWASPVIAVLAIIGMRVVPYFQFGAAGHLKSDPAFLQNEQEVEPELVNDFLQETSPVSTESDDTEAALPEWTKKRVMLLASTKGHREQEVRRVVTESHWEKSIEAARESLLVEAAQVVQEDFQRFYPGGKALPKEAIGKHALKAEAIEVQSHENVDTPFKMYKVYAQVELSPKVRQELSGTWKTEVAMRRSELLAAVLGLLTLIAGSFAAYFHLDKKSNGNYRFRLKLAATALMTAGGLGLLAALSNMT